MLSSYTQIYQGWWDEMPKAGISKFNIFAYHEWEEFGDGELLYWALIHVIGEQTEFGSDAPVNNYRLKGQGSIFDIELSN